MLQSQKLNLLDQNRFFGLFLTDPDPVLMLGVGFPRLEGQFVPVRSLSSLNSSVR